MGTINLTASYWKEISEKIKVYKQVFNSDSNLIIEKYTEKFENLLIIFQAFPKNYPARKIEEFKKMRRKTKTLELYLVLDYDKIMSGTDEENLAHIKDVFLKGCETFLKPLKGFDWEKFELKLKELLS